MIIHVDLLILFLAATFTPTSQAPCKFSVYCFCASTGKSITLTCVEDTDLDSLCEKWPSCVVCSKGQDCQACSGESRCTEARQPGKARQKRQEDRTSENGKSSCTDPGLIAKGIRRDADGTELSRNSRRRYREGETVTFSCKSQEDTIEGSAVLTCSNGLWSAPRPRCSGLKGDQPPTASTSEQPSSRPCPCANGGRCDENSKCICPPGWRGRLCESDFSKFRCTDPGFTSNSIRRDMDGTEVNRGFRRTYEDGEFVVFRCKSKEHTIEGSSTLLCTGGSWSAPRPRCVQTAEVLKGIPQCNNPGEIPNGAREYFTVQGESSAEHLNDPKYPVGVRLEYWCEDGYDLEGDDVLFCESSGSWSSDPPSCRIDNGPKLCSYPGPISNGQVSYIPARSEGIFRPQRRPIPVQNEVEFPPGTTLEYACNSGYTMHGVRSLICQSTGIWSNLLPSCNKGPKYTMFCESRRAIENGRVTTIFPNTGQGSRPSTAKEVPEGTILQYECEDGYDLRGSSKVTCLDTSFWSAPPPTCTAECGISGARATGHVINGLKTTAGDWPWVVAIAVERRNGYKEKVCAGAVWSSSVVVTAAHCLTIANTYTLYFGKLFLEDVYDDADVQVRTSTQVIIHPDYNNVTYEFDIGLIMFENRITFSNRTRPICPTTFTKTALNLMTGKNGYVTGWGETERQVQASSLLLAVLPYQTNEACRDAYLSHNLTVEITRNMFCAGFENGHQSACSGDSGSPLVFYDTNTMRFYLEGIVSFGVQGQCGMPRRYTVFTSVYPCLPWITKSVSWLTRSVS